MTTGKFIDRRQALKALGTSSVAPVLAHLSSPRLLALGHHPLVRVQAGESWAPRFLTPHENETVATLAELIIPETDTPGARTAYVNQYIDHVLAAEGTPAATRDAFRGGLAWMDRASQERFGANVIEADPAQQTALLTELVSADPGTTDRTGIEFFGDIRMRTIEGYYGSEVGMFDELGFQGNSVLHEFHGCTHPEHLNWKPTGRNGNEE